MKIHLAIPAFTTLLLAACHSTPRAESVEPEPQAAAPSYVAYFAPGSSPRFVVIEREPVYALVPDDARDVIAFRAISVANGNPTGAALSCFITLPPDAPLDTPLHLANDEGPTRGWAIIDTPNVERRIAALSGAVIILDRTPDGLSAVVDLTVTDDDRIPAIQGAATASRTPRRNTIATPALTTRSGVGHAPPPPKPERRKTESTWPWAEIMGDYPPPAPNYSTRAAPPRPINN